MNLLKSIRIKQYQYFGLEGLKLYLRKKDVTDVNDSVIFRAMLNFAVKNKTVVKEIIRKEGLVKIDELVVK